MDWNAEWNSRLNRPEDARSLLTALKHEPAAAYELLFHSAFAGKLLGVMRKGGHGGQVAEGFGRMQQTFGEAVEKVQAAIQLAAEHGFEQAASYTDRSPEAMRRLLELMQDL